MMDGLGETELVHASLQSAFQEVFNAEGEHVIELHAGFVEHTDADETANEGVAFEETLGVLFIESEKLSGILISIISFSRRDVDRTEQRVGSWRESIAPAKPHACCADHIRRRV